MSSDLFAIPNVAPGVTLKDKWRLDRLVAEGGMAVVYSATHRNGKRAAIKILRPFACQDPQLRASFLSEGYAANSVGHPGAVSVEDDDVTSDGYPFLVMELLEGESLDARMQRSDLRLSVSESLGLMESLLDLLRVAHERGIVHADIKPENIFLASDGRIKLLDFGIARVFAKHRVDAASSQQKIVGTPAYMAPEQAQGRFDAIDGRTDVFAVGATLFVLLTGSEIRQSASDDPLELLAIARERPPPRLGDVAPHLPRALCQLVDGALAFEKKYRCTAGELLEGIRKVRALSSEAAPDVPDDRAPSSTWNRVADVEDHRPSERSAGSMEVRPSNPRAERSSPVVSDDESRNSSVTDREPPVRPVSPSTIPRLSVAEPVSVISLQDQVARARQHVDRCQAARAESKQKLLTISAKLTDLHHEKAALEDWYSRKLDAKSAGVEEARTNKRERLIEFATLALGDKSFTHPDLHTLREGVMAATRRAEAAAAELRLHEMALRSYDERSYRRGIVLGAVLLLAFVALPIIWRATYVAPPPELPPAPRPSR